MLVSHRWLRELLPELQASPAEVEQVLSSIGLAVDGLSYGAQGLDPVWVAAVQNVEPHPTHSALKLITVDVGQGRSERVVCGAPNVPGPGGLVILAEQGAQVATIPEPLSVRSIGGVPSAGMLCSEAELDLAESSEGLLVLAPGAASPGTPVPNALPEIQDAIYLLDVTPNRPDALGHWGVARDLGAALGLGLRRPTLPEGFDRIDQDISARVVIENRAPERCSVYGAALAVNVEVGSSPEAMRWRLHRLGIRSISNVVDITNWLMMLYGHPTHAFDFDRLVGGRIVVRMAEPNERFTTLDRVARKLDSDDLVIADAERVTALAGVMGGADSEIRPDTRRVLLECAHFSARGVRRTSRRHGLLTESSRRFERGVDWGHVAQVLEHGKALLKQHAGADVDSAIRLERGEQPPRPEIRLRSRRLDAMLGVPVPFDEAKDILKRLDFSVRNADDAEPACIVDGASHRPDVTLEADLVEEVARMRGLDLIPSVLPALIPQEPRETGKLNRRLASIATELGLSEVILYGFVSPQALDKVGAQPSPVRLKNPLGEERSVMRTSLLPGLLEIAGRTRRRGENTFSLYAIGNIFLPPGSDRSSVAQRLRPIKDEDRGALPVESPCFAAILGGPRAAYLKKPDEVDIFDAKGIAVELVERLLGLSASVRHAPGDADTRHLHPRGAAKIFVDGRPVGRFGPLHPDVADAFDLGAPLQVIELELTQLEQFASVTPQYRPIPRLPAIVRDLSFELPTTLPAEEIAAAVRQAAGELCESVTLFDLYQGRGVPEGRRALAFRLVYRDPKAATEPEAARSLTDAEVDRHQSAVLAAVAERFGVTIRG